MSRIELNRINNPACIHCNNKDERAKVTEKDICNRVKSIEDNLPIRCVGEWAEEKIYLLRQYFGIFSGGMKKKWDKINYIEICSGPGRCINRKSGSEFDGTAIAILKHDNFNHINKALFFDYDNIVIETLNQRIKKMGLYNKACAIRGDYNNPSTICDSLKILDSANSLNLVFIDPTDCSLPFSLLKSIAIVLSKFDLIINVATGTDFNRNIPMAFADSLRAEKYNNFLGDSDFFTDSNNQMYYRNKNYTKLREMFRKTYENSLKQIGFKYFDYTPVKNYYDILFATSNSKGIEFWKKAAKTIDASGQRTLDFEL